VAQTSIDERRFTDLEVSEILKKAVEKGPSRSLARGQGLSLAELKSIGSEVGIDPVRVEEAARSVIRDNESRSHGFIGASTILRSERRVEGEFRTTDAPEVLSIIRRTMGVQGEVSEVGGALEWSTKGDSVERFVTVSSKEGTVAIQGSSNLKGAARVAYGMGVLLSVPLTLVGIILDDASAAGLAFALAFLATVYLVLRTGLQKISTSEAAKLLRVVDEVAQLSQASDDHNAGFDRAT
jgi:hypothetical protein